MYNRWLLEEWLALILVLYLSNLGHPCRLSAPHFVHQWAAKMNVNYPDYRLSAAVVPTAKAGALRGGGLRAPEGRVRAVAFPRTAAPVTFSSPMASL